MNAKESSPESWHPQGPAEFLGDARRVVSKLGEKIDHQRSQGRLGSQRWLFLGPPGIGKTEAALALSRKLVSHPSMVEEVNGQSCTVDLVRRWRESQPYRPLFGDAVKLIDELDLASPAAQNELLSYLDRLPSWLHVIATTNRELEALQPRLQTRFAQFPFSAVATPDIASLLGRFGLGLETARAIAAGAAGNVRAALFDAQAVLDLQ